MASTKTLILTKLIIKESNRSGAFIGRRDRDGAPTATACSPREGEAGLSSTARTLARVESTAVHRYVPLHKSSTNGVRDFRAPAATSENRKWTRMNGQGFFFI
jgi:hypothetical protein